MSAVIPAREAKSSAVINIAKVDFEARTSAPATKKIADNEIPLAAAPSESDINMAMWWILVAVSVTMTGIVIIESRKEKRS